MEALKPYISEAKGLALKNAEEAKRFLKNVPKGLARKQAGSAL
ncbi:hypothetical protein [Methanocella conradii]|nr:hypothetical protein [Methanocella conradii]